MQTFEDILDVLAEFRLMSWIHALTCTMGSTKASVLPLPVGAEQQMSQGRYPALPIRPVFTVSNKMGITWLWTANTNNIHI